LRDSAVTFAPAFQRAGKILVQIESACRQPVHVPIVVEANNSGKDRSNLPKK